METYDLKLTPAEQKYIQRAASAEGVTVEEYLRQRMLEAGSPAYYGSWDQELDSDPLWQNTRYRLPD